MGTRPRRLFARLEIKRAVAIPSLPTAPVVLPSPQGKTADAFANAVPRATGRCTSSAADDFLVYGMAGGGPGRVVSATPFITSTLTPPRTITSATPPAKVVKNSP